MKQMNNHILAINKKQKYETKCKWTWQKWKKNITLISSLRLPKKDVTFTPQMIRSWFPIYGHDSSYWGLVLRIQGHTKMIGLSHWNYKQLLAVNKVVYMYVARI
jgi:hypothetical protein